MQTYEEQICWRIYLSYQLGNKDIGYIDQATQRIKEGTSIPSCFMGHMEKESGLALDWIKTNNLIGEAMEMFVDLSNTKRK
jgi:hypothetical protein